MNSQAGFDSSPPLDLTPPPGVSPSTWVKCLAFVAEQALAGEYFAETFGRAMKKWPSIAHDHTTPVGSRAKIQLLFELVGGVWSSWSDPRL